jgi:hypothetical protein
MNRKTVASAALIFLANFVMGLSLPGNTRSLHADLPKISQNQLPVSLRGKISDEHDQPLQGASIVIVGTTKGVSANETGYYYFDKLPEGQLSVQVSLMGFKAQTINAIVHSGHNELNFLYRIRHGWPEQN